MGIEKPFCSCVAKALTVTALVFFLLPVFIMSTGYVEGLGIFLALYLLTAIFATITSIIAARYKLIAILYGIPILVILTIMI